MPERPPSSLLPCAAVVPRARCLDRCTQTPCLSWLRLDFSVAAFPCSAHSLLSVVGHSVSRLCSYVSLSSFLLSGVLVSVFSSLALNFGVQPWTSLPCWKLPSWWEAIWDALLITSACSTSQERSDWFLNVPDTEAAYQPSLRDGISQSCVLFLVLHSWFPRLIFVFLCHWGVNPEPRALCMRGKHSAPRDIFKTRAVGVDMTLFFPELSELSVWLVTGFCVVHGFPSEF